MKAIETKFISASDRRGSRIIASDGDCNRVTIDYPHELSGEAVHRAAAEALCRKMGWTGEMIGGATKLGHVFVFVESAAPVKPKDYNGWSNYETWAVWVWMDNNAGDQAAYAEMAAEVFENAKADKHFTREERAALTLLEQIKDQHENNMPEIEGFAADLLNGAMSEVNWHEIAKHLVDAVAAESEVV